MLHVAAAETSLGAYPFDAALIALTYATGVLGLPILMPCRRA